MAKVKTAKKRSIWFPGETSWEQWFVEDGRDATMLTEVSAGERDFALNSRGERFLALPVTSVVALPLLSSAPDSAGLRSTAEIQAERSGIGHDLKSIGFEVLSGQAPRTFLRVEAAVSESGNWDGMVFPDHVVSSASLLPWKGDQIAVWRELGHLVVGFSKGGRLVFFDRLSVSNLGVECGVEIQRLLFQLNCQGIELMPEAITLWASGGDSTSLQSALGIAVHEEPRPAPSQNPGCELAPRWLRDQQQRGVQRAVLRKRLGAIAAVGMVLVGALGAMIGVETVKQNRLRERITELSPLANRVESMAAKWKEVSPAVDRDATPLEVMKAIQRTPGANAVRFRRMEIADGKIVLEGQSASPGAALQFLDEMTIAGELAEYGWEFDQPEISPGGAATFQIEGVK